MAAEDKSWALAPTQSSSTYRKLLVHQLTTNFREAVSPTDVPFKTALPAGKALVRRLYTGVNASDINFTSGRYYGTREQAAKKLPFDVGFESVGIIAALGPGPHPEGIFVGAHVASMTYGGFSEFGVLSTRHLIPVGRASPAVVAMLLSGLTASIGLQEAGRMTTGEVVMITAAAGGTGMFAVQLAKLAGNHVIGTCGSDEKADMLRRLGVDRVINYNKENVKKVLRNEYPRGVDVVYESVGGEMFNTTFGALAVGGRLVVIGMMSQYTQGKDQTWNILSHKGIPEKLLAKSTSLNGFFVSHYPQHFRKHMARLIALHSSGHLKVEIDPKKFIGLDSVPDAVEYLHSGGSQGKVVVQIAGDVPHSSNDTIAVRAKL